MKEERLAILGMLEKGIISVLETERLLNALKEDKSDMDGISSAVGEVFNKTGKALNSFAKSVGEKAEKLEPKVKETAEKVSDKVAEKATMVLDDAKTYMEKLKQKKSRDKEFEDEDFSDLGFEDMDFDETVDESKEEDSEALGYTKNLNTYMDNIQMQVSQLDEAEAFLKNAFTEEELEDIDELKEETKK